MTEMTRGVWVSFHCGDGAEIGRNKDEIRRILGALDRHDEGQGALLSCVHLLTEQIMATREDVSNELSALRDLINQDQQSDQQVVDTLNATITDLGAQLDNLRSHMSEEQASAFDTIIAQLRDVKSSIRAVSVTSRGGGMSEVDVPKTPTSSPDSPAEIPTSSSVAD